MKELSLHILDNVENSINANASRISISIHEDITTDEIIIQIKDDGVGMKKEVLEIIADPFITTRKTRNVGLGIPLLKAAAEEANGHFLIHSELGNGTNIKAKFQRNHIDRMPIGDIESTFLSLIVSYPKITWEFDYSINKSTFKMTNTDINEIMEDLPLTEPDVLKYLRSMIETGISEVKNSLEFASAS